MGYRIPGKIVVADFSLLNDPGEKSTTKTNVWPLVDGMSIYESIFRANMWGMAKIKDSYNLYSNLPITNDTYLRIRLLDPTTGQNISMLFRVYKVSSIEQLSPSMQTYIIHFVSIDMYASQYIRISKHVTGNIPSEIENIHKQISSKPIEIIKDAAKTNIYLPYLTAQQAIKILLNNATWNITNPDYCYWESIRSYYCKPLSACILENDVHELSTNAKFYDSTTSDFDFGDFTKISDMYAPKTYDGIKGLYQGYDGATIYNFDPIKGVSTGNALGESPSSRMYTFSDSSLNYKMLSKRMQLLKNISMTYFTVQVPGFLGRATGDLANVTICSSNSLGIPDTTLSGKKLICGIVHVISVDEYKQNITLGDYGSAN